MMRFTIVETNLHTPLHGLVQHPVHHAQCAFKPPDVAQGDGETSPTRTGGQIAQDQVDMRRGFSGSVRARRSRYAMNGWLVSSSRVAA